MADDEITPKEFAEALDVHYDTILKWCFRAVCEVNDPLHHYVRQTVTGRYRIKITAIELVEELHGPA